MSNKKLWSVIGVVLAIAIIGGIVYYLTAKQYVPPNEDTAAIDELNNLLDTGAGIPDIHTPSANPLDKVAPSENPIDKTNPFAVDDYENPFE